MSLPPTAPLPTASLPTAPLLTANDIARFREDGYVMLPGLVDAGAVTAMQAELDRWIEESRGHTANWGELPRGKLRFDLEAGHSAVNPKLRRVANPVDLSAAYRRVLWDGPVVDQVAALIGPAIKFHHCKLNVKLPGMETYVGWHQDHPFDPHTNDDVVGALVLLDDMNLENGCLMVVPGSHKQPMTHYRGDRFVGEAPAEAHADFAARAIPILGRAGDVCLIDTWMAHGSAPNRSTRPRRMLICDYTAADAFPLMPLSVPTVNTGRILRGEPTRIARFRAGTVELPPAYQADSFFTVQGQQTAAA
ncbi:MAG TPA: phytanoyl-CoA dioxygenase family protein [Stellaceae bacterium]|nr:phytanoyl-CoA dioxygenase family protein [Stellaceae bacterium]